MKHKRNHYRAKRLCDGEWISGQLIENGEQAWIVTEQDLCKMSYPTTFPCQEVDKNTIGAYSGMFDKTGSPIFEGDIVKFDDTPYNVYASPYEGEVRISRGQWSVYCFSKIFDRYLYRPLYADDFAERKTVILGNIYDTHPESKNKDTDF